MRKLLIGATALSCFLGAAANAAAIPYPDSGTYNTHTYTFTAAGSGDLVGYFVDGGAAGYENQVGVLINGVFSPAGFGLDNHASAVGDSFNFGHVDSGDVLTFVLHNLSTDGYAYSNPALNVAYDYPGETNHNHVYSTVYAGGDPALTGVPAGIYVAFEDLAFPGSDYNYNDESFVFTNTHVEPASVPEPTSWALMLGGFGMVGGALRSRRKATVSFA